MGEKRRRRIRLTRLSKVLIFIVIISGAAFLSIKLSALSKEGNPKNNETALQTSKTVENQKSTSSINVKPSAEVKTTDTASKNNNTNASTKNPSKTTKVDSNSKSKLVSSNTADNKKFFAKSVFVGDSISEGLAYCDYINDSNVVAEKGMTIAKVKKRVSDIVSPKPQNVFIMFGMNDILCGVTSDKFAASYLELIKMIKAKQPDCNIYIQSILPVDEWVSQKRPALNNRNIDTYNRALIDMAKKENINYLNVASVVKKSSESLHEGDGIHFKFKFYDLWLQYIKNNI